MFTPSELGFDEIPQTSSLKVQTSQMAARVRTLLSNEQENSTNNYKVTVKEHVLVAYRKATGIPVDKLTMDATVSQFADSIALMRVRHYLRKSLGQTLSIQEMVDKPTIASQIETLHSQGPNSDEIRVDALPDVLLLNVEHLNILFGGPEEARTMQLRISDILRAKKLSWTHVLSIIPVHDYMQVLLDSGIVDTWNFAIAVSTKASSIAVCPRTQYQICELAIY
jgi:aryl carrier-like protein